MLKKKFFTLALIIIVFFCLSTAVLAQTIESQTGVDSSGKSIGYTFGSDFGQAISQIYTLGAALLVVITIVMAMAGGVEWIVAAGDETKITNAKGRIFKALLGLTIALFSVTFLNWVNPATTTFKDITIVEIDLAGVICCQYPDGSVDFVAEPEATLQGDQQGPEIPELENPCPANSTQMEAAECFAILSGESAIPQVSDGADCETAEDCLSQKCDPLAKKCIPKFNSGQLGEFCNNFNQCRGYELSGAQAEYNVLFCRRNCPTCYEGTCQAKLNSGQNCRNMGVGPDKYACNTMRCSNGLCSCNNNAECPAGQICNTDIGQCFSADSVAD